jgi:Zn-dependent peptidase ImmA (M78 family)
MPRVNPEILRWARESAGLSLEEAARRIDLSDARGVTATERLAALEAGEGEPTRPLLVRMAKQYRRPLLTFYLGTPPRKANHGQDFRTLPEDYAGHLEPVLDVLLRDILTRQALVKAALEDEEEPEPLRWVGSASMEEGIPRLVQRIREALALSLTEYRAAPDAEEAFKFLRERVERLGAFVVLASNLGSHHTALGVDVFRGFAIADPIAPFIVVNDQDSRAAWSFTLLHELAHLWLGYTGVSGGEMDRDLERFCNEVASELLLPAAELGGIRIRHEISPTELASFIGELAGGWRLSRSLVAYRLYRMGSVSRDQWRALSRLFRDQWLEQRERRREAGRESTGGPNYYVVKRHRLGNALVQTTARLMRSGALTTTKAGQVLGVRPGNVGALVAGVAGGERSAR